jgi:hypothetical protein
VANHIALERTMTERDQEQLLATATDRFERRLAEEIGAVRVAIVEGDTATRLEVAKLRVDMAAQFATARVETEARHRELLKWALVFWMGQAAAVAGLFEALT